MSVTVILQIATVLVCMKVPFIEETCSNPTTHDQKDNEDGTRHHTHVCLLKVIEGF